MPPDEAISEAIEALLFIIGHADETGFDPSQLRQVISFLECQQREERPCGGL